LAAATLGAVLGCGVAPAPAGALGIAVFGVAALEDAAGALAAVVAEVDPKSAGFPLWICQLFQRSNRENEKIIQRMVRRISMIPRIEEAGRQSAPV
jgi:hypothetical protein